MTNDACAGEYLLKIDMEVNFLLLWDQNCWLCGMAVTLALEKCQYKLSADWAIPEKSKWGGRGGGWVEDMEFSGVSKKEYVEFPGVN